AMLNIEAAGAFVSLLRARLRASPRLNSTDDAIAPENQANSDGRRPGRLPMNPEQFFEILDSYMLQGWKRIHDGRFWRHLEENGLDHGLYIALMTEVFHYTRHNAQNQALASLSAFSDRLGLLQFCLRHAYAEAGHDLMVLADLEAIGIDR